jgi:hypothetical protein
MKKQSIIIGILIINSIKLQAAPCKPPVVQIPNCARKVICQRDIPFTIQVPGKYILGQNVQNPTQGPAITVNVPCCIDLCCNTIDLAGAGGTGILINSGISGVQIYNGTIQNSGTPGAVAATVPAAMVDITTITSLTEGRNLFLAATQFQYPFAVANPANGVGIFLQSSVSDVIINNMTFLNDFIGVGALGSNNNVVVSKSEAYDCGFNFGSSLGLAPLRGGGFIFFNQPSTFSSDIQIENCILSSFVSLQGILFLQALKSTIKNCESTSALGAGTGTFKIENFAVLFSDGCVVENSNARGGQSGFGFFASTNGAVKNCKAFDFCDNGFDIDFTLSYTVQDCISTNIIPVASPNPFINKAVGFSSFFSQSVNFENCVTESILSPLPGLSFSAGFSLAANNAVIKNCISINNAVGYLLLGSSNCQLDDNIALGNAGPGFINVPIFLLPATNNTFLRNESFNNAVPYIGVVNAPIISVSANGSTPVAPYVNLEP